MRTSTISEPLAATTESELRVPTVTAVAAAASAVAGPTLVALTHGWDYRLAALVGMWIAAGCLIVAGRTVHASDVRGRTNLEFPTAFAAVLLCVYASDWVDWQPFGMDDALAGLLVGLVLVVAGPVQRGVRLAAAAPEEAVWSLQTLVIAPAVVPLLAHFFAVPDALGTGQIASRTAGFGFALVLSALGLALAVRRGLFEAVFSMSLLFGLGLFALLAGNGVAYPLAALCGALAWGGLFLIGIRAWLIRNRWEAQPGDLVAWLAIASAAVVHLHPASIGWLVAGLFGAGWWLESSRAPPTPAPAARTVRSDARAVLPVVYWVSLMALFYMQGALLTAAVANATGPMVLASITRAIPIGVSEITFSELLLADQYLWRDTPAPSRLVAAGSPDRMLQLLRSERDRWSGAELVAVTRARMERRPRGMGLVFGPEDADELRIAYVYPGSPAERAGVRRGDILRAINDTTVAALLAGSAPVSPWMTDPTRLELVSPGQAPRTVTITLAEYAKPAVSAETVLTLEGRRVGYVVLHSFRPSTGEEFAKAAARLRAQGIDELVLDLRMNHGGSVLAARDVASTIGGRRLDGEVFQEVVHNKRYRDRDEKIPFRVPDGEGLLLKRLVVITTAETCSASEAVINGLAPFMDVVTVGSTTCGKPVGMAGVEYGDHLYWVITFEVRNARGEGGYYNGLRPTCAAEDDFTRDLGDPEEASLEAALEYLREGRCPTRAPA